MIVTIILIIRTYLNICTNVASSSIYFTGVNSSVNVYIDGVKFGNTYFISNFQTNIIYPSITYNQIVEFEVTSNDLPSNTNIPGFIASIYFQDEESTYEEHFTGSHWYAGLIKAKEYKQNNMPQSEYMNSVPCNISQNANWIWDSNFSQSVMFTTLIREKSQVDFKISVDDYVAKAGIQDENGNLIREVIINDINNNWTICRQISLKGYVKTNYYVFVDGCNGSGSSGDQHFLYVKVDILRESDFPVESIIFTSSNAQCCSISGVPDFLSGSHPMTYFSNYSTPKVLSGKTNFCSFGGQAIWQSSYTQCTRCRVKVTTNVDTIPIS